ncbi:hypothetical protein FBQ82_22100 [Anaerolineae bacterium CFX7]|nr:hypothetical protein [Anaerolineae bacterium CFX7]
MGDCGRIAQSRRRENIVRHALSRAAHYHELTQLAVSPTISSHGGAVKNFTMAVQESDNRVIFLRQVIQGGAAKSFGIHVAQLAGLPQRVIERANEVLRNLEETRETDDERRTTDDHLSFRAEREISVAQSSIVREERALYDARVEAWRDVLRELSDADIANMTPVQALVLLNEMQVRIKELDSRIVG